VVCTDVRRSALVGVALGRICRALPSCRALLAASWERNRWLVCRIAPHFRGASYALDCTLALALLLPYMVPTIIFGTSIEHSGRFKHPSTSFDQSREPRIGCTNCIGRCFSLPENELPRTSAYFRSLHLQHVRQATGEAHHLVCCYPSPVLL